MQKNITQLIAHFLSEKRYVAPASVLLLFLVTSLYVWASVTPGSTPTLVPADYALNATAPNPTYANGFLIGPIVIAEDASMEFKGGTNGYIELKLPTGWEFDVTSTVNPVVDGDSRGGQNISASVVTPISTSTIRINVSQSGTNRTDRLTISGIRVRQVVGSLTQSPVGDITYSASSTSVVTGLANSTVLSRLQKIPGAAAKIGFTTPPGDGLVNENLSQQPVVAVQDQFGNTATNATGTVSLSLTGTPSTAQITSGATATLSNGVAQFNNVSIDEGGNFQLLASYSSTVQGASNTFVVNNKVPAVSQISPCITAGSEVNTITVTGTNFVRGSVVRINGSDRTTTFISSTTLSAALSDTDMSTAQTLSLTVLNPVPGGGLSTAVDLVVHPVYNVGAITGDNTVCENTPSVTYSVQDIGAGAYKWTVGAGATIVSGGTSNTITVNFSSGVSSVTISVQAENACGVRGSASTREIAVTPYPTGVSAGADDNFCTGTSITLGSGGEAVAGYIYEWSPATGLSSTTVPNPTLTLTNSTSATEFHTYTLSVRSSSNADCEVTDQVTVGVYPEMVTVADDLGPVCAGGVIELRATGDAGFSYSWTGPNGFTSSERYPRIENATAANAGEYTVEVTNLNGCVGTDKTTVRVVELPTADAGADDATCSEGTSTSFTVSGTATGGAGVWSVVEGVASISVATSSTTHVSVSSKSATLRFTVENSDGCAVYDDVVLTVDPLPTASIEEGQMIDGEKVTFYCEGTATLTAQAGEGYIYSWYREEGATDAFVGDERVINVTVGGYYVVVEDGNTCSSTSGVTTVKQTIVNYNRINASQEVCYNTAPATLTGSLAESTEGGEVSYRWEVSTTDPASGTAVFNTVSGETEKDLVLAAHTADRWYRRVATIGSCSVPSDVVKITVKPELKLSSMLEPPAICSGATFNYIPTSVTANVSFSWERLNITGISSATGQGSISQVLTNSTSNPIEVTYRYTLQVDGCSKIEDVIVRVNPLPETTITAESATTFCQGGSVVLSAPEGSYAYQWLRDGASISAEYGGTARQYTASTAGNYTVRVTNTTTNCVATTPTATPVTVNPQPSVRSASAFALSKCVGANSTTVFDLTGEVANGTPSWSFVSGSGTNTATVSNFSSPSTTGTQVTVTGIGTVTVRLTSSSSVANCNDATRDVLLTVHPYPTASAGPNLEACVGSNNITKFIRQGSGSEGTVSWTIKSEEGASVTNLAYPWLYESFVEVTGVGSVTLTLSVTKEGCTTTDDVTYTVKPRPTVNAVENQTYCNGDAGSSINFGSSLSGSSFTWTSSRDIGFGTSGSGNIAAYTATNTGTAPVTATVRVIATLDNCPGAERSFTITVNPTPKLSSTQTPAAVCSGYAFNYTATSATASAFSWSRAKVPGISNDAVTNQAGNVISETLVNTTESAVSVVYAVTLRANNCTNTQNVTVSVRPNLAVSFTGTVAGTSTFYTGQGSVALSAEPTGGVFSSPTAGAVTLSNGVYSFNPCAAKAGTHTITYTRTTGSCTSTVSKTVTVVQSTYRAVITTNPQTFCKGGGGATYTAAVYRDVQPDEIIYPYLVDANGQPVDKAGNLIENGAGNYPVANDKPVSEGGYPFPANTPEAVKALAYRFFQPIVSTALASRQIDVTAFEYQWAKNHEQSGKKDSYQITDAGLSSQDYYNVLVTSGSYCESVTLQSNRIYTATIDDYNVVVTATPNPICPMQAVTFQATLGTADATKVFPWDLANVKVAFVLRRNNADVTLATVNYSGSRTVSYTTDYASAGGFINGDQVSARLISDVDSYFPNSNCTGLTTSNPVTINVVVSQTLTGGGAYCEGGTGVPVGLNGSQQNVSYQLLRDGANVGSPVIGTGSAISFGNQTVAGTYTVKTTTASGSACTTVFGNVKVSITPLPIAYDITGGGEYCSGGVGVAIGLSNSQAGVTYRLMRGSDLVATVTRTQAGSFSFGSSFKTAGTYTVEATTNANATSNPPIAACPRLMNKSAIIVVNELPTVTVNSETICEGDAATIAATLDGGTGPYTYTWTVPASAINPGNVASFSTKVAGNYTVSITDSKNCASSQPATGAVTVKERVTATGDILATDGNGNVITPEVGKSVTYIAQTNFGINNSEVGSYSWETSNDGITWRSGGGEPTLVVSPVLNSDLYVRVTLTPVQEGCYIQQSLVLETGKVVPLPVEIIYLNVQKQGNNVLLEWATASEKDNTGFEVQVSEDGFNYRKLEFVPSRNGNSSVKQVYKFMDTQNGKHGTRYYRLKQVDTDGTHEYFGPKAVTFGNVASKVIAFPNPFQDEITLDIASETDGEMLIVISDATGRQLMQRKVQVEKGYTTEKLKLNTGLPRGLYIIRTQVGGVTQFLKMVKE